MRRPRRTFSPEFRAKVTKLRPGTKKRYFEAEEAMSVRSRLIKIIGWPVTYSVDGITIGVK